MASDQTGVDFDGAGGVGRALPEVTLADLDIDPDFERLRYATLSARIQLSFTDMRRAVRMLLDEAPTEGRLLFYVLMSDVIFLLNVVLKFVISPSAEQLRDGLPSGFEGMIGGLLVLCFFIRTSTLYLFSGLVALVCRLIGGEGSWRDTRAGIFWASLVAAPVGVLGALMVTALDYSAAAYPILAEPIFHLPGQLIGVVAFVFFVSAAVAESHRFRATSPVFIVFSLLTVAILLGALYAGGQAMQALA